MSGLHFLPCFLTFTNMSAFIEAERTTETQRARRFRFESSVVSVPPWFFQQPPKSPKRQPAHLGSGEPVLRSFWQIARSGKHD